MEVQVAWLETKQEDPVVTQEGVTPPAGEVIEEIAEAEVVEISERATRPAQEEIDDYAVPVSRPRPPRLPGARMTLPPMPVAPASPTKPPPPPRRHTQEVEMSWVEIVDEDLTEEDLAAELAGEGGALSDLSPRGDEKPEITRVADVAASTELHVAGEGEGVEHEVLAPPPEPAVERSEPTGPPLEAEILAARQHAEHVEAEDAERMREEVLAARRREQDARDRELRERRKIERERERREHEAVLARRAQEKREEEERAAAIRQGRPDHQLLDLSGIDDEIDGALDAILGPNLSYPPPPPGSDPDEPGSQGSQ